MGGPRMSVSALTSESGLLHHVADARASYRFLRLVRQGRAPDFYDDAIFTADLTEMRTCLGRMFILNRSDLIERVLLTNSRNYAKGPMVRALFKKTLGMGLLISEAEQWRAQRKASAPAFQPRRIEDATALIQEIAANRIAAWNVDDHDFDLEREFGLLTLDVICRVLFSYPIGSGHEIYDAIRTIIWHNRFSIADYFRLPSWIPRLKHPRLRSGLQVIDDLVWDIVSARVSRPQEAPDLLSHILTGSDMPCREGGVTTELRDCIVTMLFAGHDTTAAALNWSSYLLARHPDVQERMRQEADELIGSNPMRVKPVNQLAYTRRALEEAMRLYPPAHMMARVAVRDDRLAGTPVPKGSTVIVSPFITHRKPQYWPSPETFDPDRFLPEQCLLRPRFAYHPFSGGPRVCIGQGLALTEMMIVTATMLQRYELRAPKEPADGMRLMGRVTLRSSGDLRISLHPRKPVPLNDGADRRHTNIG